MKKIILLSTSAIFASTLATTTLAKDKSPSFWEYDHGHIITLAEVKKLEKEQAMVAKKSDLKAINKLPPTAAGKTPKKKPEGFKKYEGFWSVDH